MNDSPKENTKVHNKLASQILGVSWTEWFIGHISLSCSISKQRDSTISTQNLRVTQLDAFEDIKYNPYTFETLTLLKPLLFRNLHF